MANAPEYRWVCHKCQVVNEPHTERCARCGMEARAYASQMPVAQEPREPVGREDNAQQSVVLQDPWLFFPEVIPAALVALVSPVWCVALLLRGQVGTALLLITTVVACTGGFVLSVRERQKALAYACMLGVLFGAYLAHSASS